MKIHTKRTLTLTLAMMVLAMCLTACGAAPDSSSAPQMPSTTTTTTTTTTSSQEDTNRTSHTPTGTTTTTTRAGGKNESQDRSPQSNASTTTAAATNKGGTGWFPRFKQIQSNWTAQQVVDLLGEPDRVSKKGTVTEYIYTVSDSTQGVIEFGDKGTKVWIHKLDWDDRYWLHAPSRGEQLLNQLKQIQPNWTWIQVYNLLGSPDGSSNLSVVFDAIYTVDDTTEAIVEFWGAGGGTIVYLRNTTTQQTSPLPK